MNILLIEESLTIASIIQKTLESYGYIVTFSAIDQLETKLKLAPYEFAIISTSYSKINATELCKEIRSNLPKIFIIAIHSHGSWDQKIEILKAGADDCLSFPFPTQELTARIQALLRRPRELAPTWIRAGKIEVNPDTMAVKYHKQPVTLTKKEYRLLEYLVRNRTRTVSRTELLDHVWDYRKVTGSNTVDVHIQKLRKKFSTMDNGSYVSEENLPYSTEIRTIHGVGYKLDDNFTIPNSTENIPPPEL